jgi:signal transduction histidine kinase
VTRPTRLTALTAIVLVLVPVLAVLQYRWVGELGDAARERMQRNLHNAAQQFRDSFDGELVRAYISLQVDGRTARDGDWPRYAERYAAWANTAAYAGLVANVYLIDAQAGGLRLRKWDAGQRAFAETPWAGDLAAARADFARELAAFGSSEARRFDRRVFRDSEALLVSPLVNIHIGPRSPDEIGAGPVTMFGFTVIELNLPYVREHLLPELARRHFSQSAEDGYRVAVVDASDASRIIYRTAPNAPTSAAAADVDVPLFAAHHDPLLFLGRAPAPVGPNASEKRDAERRDLVISVFRERRDERVMLRSHVTTPAAARWRLLAQHESGSLAAAVGSVRQRNLVISFGVLLLMAVSVGLLTAASRRAQRLAQQRMEFVAGVSHELRTPVAVIRSAAENLSHGVVGDAERVRRYGDAIQVEARRLGEMIERVLHFAGIESGRIARVPVALEPLIDEAVEAAVPASAGFTVERQIAPDLPPVLGDATAIRSAVQNLLGNAVKYGGDARWIRVRAAGSRTQQVNITVEDRGPGVPDADLPHIFEPFFRGRGAAEQQVPGSGLGLALVRAIAHAHGGRVDVVTGSGSGSAFTLHLPAAPATSEPVVVRSPNEAAAG